MDPGREYQALYDEALRLKKEGRLAQADQMESKAAQFLEDLKSYTGKNPDEPQTATNLLFLAEREWAIDGDVSEVQSKIEQALAIRERHEPRDIPSIAEARLRLAEFHFLAGRLGESEPHYRLAVMMLERSATSSPLFAKCAGGLAQCLASLGRAEEADPFFAKAVEGLKGLETEKRPLYFLYIARAEGLEKLGRHAQAENLRTSASALLPKGNPGEHGFQV